MIKRSMSITNAQSVLRSWMRATKVSFTVTEFGLLSNGLEIRVIDDIMGARPGLNVRAASIGSSQKSEAFATFHVITQILGYGSPIPVDRGELPKEKIYGQDIALVTMRHREFRASPDLSQDKIEEFRSTIEKVCKFFWVKNKKILKLHGYELEDLHTYAYVWAHIFAHKGEPLNPKVKDGHDAKRMLWAYLTQRFGQLYVTLMNKARATFPDYDTTHVSLTGESWDEHSSYYPSVDDDERFEDKVSHVLPRFEAQALLEKKLKTLPHNRLLSALEENISSPDRDHATKMLAARLLRKHQESCPDCLEAKAA